MRFRKRYLRSRVREELSRASARRRPPPEAEKHGAFHSILTFFCLSGCRAPSVRPCVVPAQVHTRYTAAPKSAIDYGGWVECETPAKSHSLILHLSNAPTIPADRWRHTETVSAADTCRLHARIIRSAAAHACAHTRVDSQDAHARAESVHAPLRRSSAIIVKW